MLEAQDVVEYCNHKSGTYWSDKRISNGAADPFNIKLWCLGNEMDGPWQTGAKTAIEYGRIANEASKVMKWVDDSIETVVCGSSGSTMPTFGEWEYQVLTECYRNVDYVSLHRYYGNPHNDTQDFLASTLDLDDFIKTVAAICDAVKGKKHAKKKVHLSLDEWNVWYHSHNTPHEKWSVAPPQLEDIYNFEDALLTGAMLITFLRHCDRIKIACLAQLVNVIAPIFTKTGGGIFEQTIFYPFMHLSNYGRGVALNPLIDCPKYDCKEFTDVPFIESIATLDEENGEMAIFCVNKSLSESAVLEVNLMDFKGYKPYEFISMDGYDKKAENTFGAVNVKPHTNPVPTLDGSILTAELKPMSWNVIKLGI